MKSFHISARNISTIKYADFTAVLDELPHTYGLIAQLRWDLLSAAGAKESHAATIVGTTFCIEYINDHPKHWHEHNGGLIVKERLQALEKMGIHNVDLCA